MGRPSGPPGSTLFPPIVRQNIINEWLSGVGGPELARRYHCHLWTITQIVKPYPRDHSWHQEAIRLYQTGLSMSQVATALGKTAQGVWRVLVVNDIPRRPQGGANFKGARHDPQFQS